MGIVLPDSCPKGLCDCSPLAQIVSDDGVSFICSGHNDGTNRVINADRFRVCFKNDQIDDMTDFDDRDMIDTISVMSQALSADANMSS